MIILRDLASHEAWWALCSVTRDGAEAMDAMERAVATGANWNSAYHVAFDRETLTYNVMLRLPAVG